MKALRAALVGLVTFTMSCGTEEPTAPTIQSARGGSGNLTVTSVVPDSSGRATSLDITVNGSGFDQGSEVTLERGGVPASGITTNATTYVSPRKVIANITIAADADTGKYDVAVMTTGGRKGVGIEMFNVLYELVEVGVIGGTWSIGMAVNDLGHIVGTSCTNDCLSHAFFWSEEGGLEDLGTLPGYTRSSAYSVNDLGQVLGNAGCPSRDAGCGQGKPGEVVLWQNVGGQWSATPLGIPDFGFISEGGEGDINNAGQFVVGGRPTVYSLAGGTAIGEPLPAPAPSISVHAHAINDAGIVTGTALPNDGTSEALLWFRTQSGSWSILPLGHLPGHDIGYPRGIGEVDATGRLRVVGYSALASGGAREGSAARWTLERDGAGAWQVVALDALPVPPQATRGDEAWAVNTAGEAVGQYLGGNNAPVAVKWSTTGAMETLPSLTAGMTRARAINQGGLVVGSVWDNLRDCERAAVWRLR